MAAEAGTELLSGKAFRGARAFSHFLRNPPQACPKGMASTAKRGVFQVEEEVAESVRNQGLQSDGVAPEVGVPSPHRYREAFERVLAASLAIEEQALLPINVDLPTVVATTSGKLTGILALHERAKALPEFDATVFTQLETHLLATGHAHARLMSASAPREEILALNERGLKLRRMLYADAVALATHGLIGGKRLAVADQYGLQESGVRLDGAGGTVAEQLG